MPIANAKDLLLKAGHGGYAVGAFNVTHLVQMEAAVEAAAVKKAPLIIQVSAKTAQFLNAEVMAAAFKALAQSAPVPLCLHMDHCTEVSYCKRCVDAGFTSIMIDASKQSLPENIRQTREVCDYCHARGDISVEGELGTVSGVEDHVRVDEGEAVLCDPAQALELVEATGVDFFAPAIGTAHGVYKTANPVIDVERFERIARLINGRRLRVPLVVHGGTGLPPHTVRRLIAAGGSKFNVSTDFKHTLIDTTYDYITAHRQEFEPVKIDAAVKNATIAKMQQWMDLLGCSGKA
jgi:tagatose 1,6-diphosphate aldolase GatY/KbaY